MSDLSEPHPQPRRGYHHGDLRDALLSAGEAELRDRGIEGFTLRSCAKRAGVSHGAPAHHFADANALLTALAATGRPRSRPRGGGRGARVAARPGALARPPERVGAFCNACGDRRKGCFGDWSGGLGLI